MKSILITGGCGFVGSNLAIKLKKDNPGYHIIAFDNLKRRGSELNIQRLAAYDIQFIHGDIRNVEDFEVIGEITHLIDAAAEPSVLSGINSTPNYVLNTNLNGTINSLNFALKNNAKFIFLSTSRVYPISNLNKINFKEAESRFDLNKAQSINGVSENGISEEFSLSGARSFYGTSKLSSELIIQEFTEFYGLNATINRCGVLAGPWQMGKIDQGIITFWLASHFWKKDLSYIGFGGEGKQVRDLLHIDDLYSLVKIQLENFDLYNNQIFNVGGGLESSASLKELTIFCQGLTGNKLKISSIEENRAADIPLYITDNSKIAKLSEWSPKFNSFQIVEDTFKWIQRNEKLVKMYLK